MTDPTRLPSAADMLKSALHEIRTDGDLETARLMLDIARELREGGQPVSRDREPAPAAPTDKAMADARQAYDATTYGDRAAGDTVVLHVEQPMPVPNGRGSIQALVRHDLQVRERVGIARYGTPLQAFNGRDALRDAYEEVLDLACYLRQEIAEREGK